MIEIAPYAALVREKPDAPPTRDATPAIYRHVQTFVRDGKTATRRSFVARVRLHDIPGGDILPCDAPQPAAIASALAAMREAKAQIDPPLALYNDGQKRIDALFEPLEAEPPLIDLTTPDGTHHRVWRLTDEKTMARIGDIGSTSPTGMRAIARCSPGATSSPPPARSPTMQPRASA
jgi:hypothetical protein